MKQEFEGTETFGYVRTTAAPARRHVSFQAAFFVAMIGAALGSLLAEVL